MRFKYQFASFGIDSKNVGAHVAEQCRPTTPPCDNANRCTQFEVIEYPAHTPRLRIERVDLVTGAANKARPQSFEALCHRYYKSAYFQGLEKCTQRRKRTVLDEICNMVDESGRRYAAAPYASMKKAHIRKLRDMKAPTPEAANFRLKQISALFTWAIKNDLTTFNPAEKLEKLGGGSDGYYTWTEQDVETFEAYWRVGAKPRLAMSIMLYLGVRRSDAVLIGKKHESRDGRRSPSPNSRTEEGDQPTYASNPAAPSRDPRRERARKRDLVGNGLRQAAKLE